MLANAACEKLLGYEARTLRDSPCRCSCLQAYPGHEELRAAYFRNSRPRPMGLGLSLAARHADGREIPVDISLSPIEVGGRRLTAAALRDFRGRAEDPDALRIQATALRSAANGIVITDRSGTIVWVNPAACAITGYEADELVGAHTRLLKSGEHRPDFYAELWQWSPAARPGRGRSSTGARTARSTTRSRRSRPFWMRPAAGHALRRDQGRCERPARSRRGPRHCASGARGEVAEIESLNEQLRERAIRDPLTGLHNRRYFDGDRRARRGPRRPRWRAARDPGCSTSTTSRRSTTASGTPRATSCSECSRRS